MSLIGIDVGSSSTKIAAYSETGSLLAVVGETTTAEHPSPGLWEVDPNSVWNGVKNGLRRLVAETAVRKDPPIAIAISASGREAFPVGKDGKVLGPCIMAGDVRQSGLEDTVADQGTPEFWFNACGHLPERMDPVFRLLWWMKNQSSVMAMARYFLGWHEFLTLRLTGRAVTDRSLAGKWLIYDLKSQHWSPERISQLGINPDLLPEIESWGAIIGSLDKEVSLELGLPSDIKVGVGGFDASCSALGAGASKEGTACLLSGTWEDLIVPITTPPPTSELVKRCFSVGPYPGETGLAIFGLSPNGTSAFDWARNLVGMALNDADVKLKSQGPGPSPVLAIPHLSGAAVPWTGGSKSRGALLDLTLATTSIDIVKSILESIVYDLYYTVNLLKENGVKLGIMRGAGGGIRSEWWTQLKADLTMTSVETVNQTEPGTVGAALLAGLAIGAFDNLESKLSEFTKVSRRFVPDPNRAGFYKQRIRSYKELVSDLLHTD